jgi:uncharacterized Zn finger protein
MRCPKCGGRLEINKWVLEEWNPGENYEEVYHRCINCGKYYSSGIYCNKMFPPEVKERSGRGVITVVGDADEWNEFDL